MKITIEPEKGKSIVIASDNDTMVAQTLNFILKNYISNKAYRRIIAKYIRENYKHQQDITVSKLLELLE